MDYSPTKEHPLHDLHVHVTTTMTKETHEANTTRRSTHIISGVWADSVMKNGETSGVQTTIGTAAQRRADVKIRHRILLCSIVFVATSLVAGVIAVIASQRPESGTSGPEGAAMSSALSAIETSEAHTTTKSTTSAPGRLMHLPPVSLLPTPVALTNGETLTSSLVVTALTTLSTYTIVITPTSHAASETVSSMGVSTGKMVNGTFSSSEMSTGL